MSTTAQTITADQLAELKEKAQAATPGEWKVHDPDLHSPGANPGVDNSQNEVVVWWGSGYNGVPVMADARFIASANPATVLALIATIEQQRAEISRLYRHKNEYMDAAEGTRRVLVSELERMKAAPVGVPEADAISARSTIYECAGFGTVTNKPEMQLAIIRDAGGISCCPERQMVPIAMIPAAPAAPAPEESTSLDERLKAAGMLSVAEVMAGQPMDAFIHHAGVVDLETFGQWLEMKRKEFVTKACSRALEKSDDDELYEWVFAHAAVFSEAHINFKAAMAAQEPKCAHGKWIDCAVCATPAAEQLDSRNDLREEIGGLKSVSRMLFEELKRLTFHARTTGGTAGPDSGLILACEQAEHALSLGAFGKAYMEGADTAAEQPDTMKVSREQIARAIWNVLREYEDRCDMELEDMPSGSKSWEAADAVRDLLGKDGEA